MEINVYNYTCTTKVGSLRALECTLTQTIGEYSTVAITIDRYDYTDRCKSFCLLNNHIIAQDGEYYAIRRIDEYEKTVKIDCTHYAVNLSNIYCVVWNHKTIDEWFLTGLVSQINRALTGQNTYMVLDNVSNVPFSSTLHIDINGLVLPSTLNTPVYDVDFFGMTLPEILTWICDELNLKAFYVGDTIYLSNLLEKLTEEKLRGRSGRLVFKDGLQCHDLEIIRSVANYKAAVRPFCVIDRNDRLKKEQYTYVGEYKYNEEYRASHVEADCQKLAEVHTFKTPFEWDRRIKSNINLYDKWHQTDTEFNRRRFKCTVNYAYAEFPSGVGDVTICNVIGEEIGTATVPTSGSANIYNYEGTAIGYCEVHRVTIGEEDNWVVHYYIHCNYFGIWSSAYGDVDLYIDGDKTELDIYDCVHNKIGVVSLSGTREGTYVLNYIQPENSEETEPQIPGTDGHITTTFNQAYSIYFDKVVVDLGYQAQDYVNSYTGGIIENASFSICTEAVTPTESRVLDFDIFAGKTVYIASNYFQSEFRTLVTSITFDLVRRKYVEIQTGYVKGSLKKLGLRN